MKKIAVVALCTVLCVLLVAACAEAKYTPGVYVGKGMGHAGELQVSVVVTEDAITGLDLISCEDTYYIYPVAEKAMLKRIIDAQSLAVDTVSGATRTSKGILAAVEDAMTQANANMDALKTPIAREAVDQEVSCDVLVVGAGLTGLAAANRLLENGVDVLMIESMGYTGGAARFSGGTIRIADDEEYAEKAFNYMQSMMYYADIPVNEKYPDLERVKDVCYKSIDVYNWQMRNGVAVENSLEDVTNTFTRRPYIPAEYNYLGVSRRGNFLTQQYEDVYLNHGGKLMLETKADSLITDAEGKVVGAKAHNAEGNLTINARAVILCTGSVGNNQELIAQVLPAYVGDLTELPIGTDGSGIQMALDLGAVMTEDQYCNGGASHAYPVDAYHVNGKYASRQDLTTASMFCSIDGERRAREDDDRYLRKYTVMDGPNQQFCISDTPLLQELGRLERMEAEVEKCGNKGPYYKADSIAELAELMGVDPEVLTATIDRYNGFCVAGEDADFGKSPELLNAIDEGPFYAVKTTFLGFDYVGGIETANDGAVQKADGSVIPGLYAAGFTSSREFLGTGSAHSYCLIICVSTGFISADAAQSYIAE